MQHCCKTSWKAMLHVLLSWNRTCLATNQVVETFCCKTGLNAGGKTRNIAYNSFCSDVARQVSCTFLLPVSPYTCSFCRWRILVINKPWWGSKSPKIPLRVCSSQRLVTPIQTYSARVLNRGIIFRKCENFRTGPFFKMSIYTFSLRFSGVKFTIYLEARFHENVNVFTLGYWGDIFVRNSPVLVHIHSYSCEYKGNKINQIVDA